MSTVELVQQVIVPAYVWQDVNQRRGVCVKAAQALLVRAASSGVEIDGEIEDAEIVPTFLMAQVGEADGARFVAYEQCDAAMADLVFVTVSVKAVEP